MRRESLSTAAIITLFAVAHALTAIVSRAFDYIDDVPLTVLTISMIVIIAIRRSISTEITAAIALIACFVGYLLGVYGAEWIMPLIGNDYIVPALTTFLITQMIGWSTYAISKYRPSHGTRRVSWSPSTQQIVTTAAAILLLRIFYALIFRSDYFIQTGIYPEFLRLFENTFALMFLLCGNIIFIGLMPKFRGRLNLRSGLTMLFAALFSLLITLCVYYDLPMGNGAHMESLLLFRLYAVILLADIVTFTIMSLINHVIVSGAELRTERGKKHHAQFQYNKLKQQINPHFLFNSLNILDFLVQEHETERASAFIRKLAGIYRYMLKNEDEQLTMLRDELTFATMYIELLKERFTVGFTVETDIPAAALRRYVVPCSLQLLIENATKHNAISAEMPLTVHIGIEDDLLVVWNNLRPRISAQASTHMGLHNITQQYLDISGRSISIEKTRNVFRVKLPLL